MARYRDSVCKLCRREQKKLFLKGTRCNSDKCSFERRSYIPGQHGNSGGYRRRPSDYAVHLREKQKLRRIFGVLERQFRKYFKMAAKETGVTGSNLLKILERRLDNVIYRMGFAPSRQAARQLINHGHIKINGRKLDIPSYLVEENDEIEIKEKSRGIPIIQGAIEAKTDSETYEWFSVDADNFKGAIKGMPTREEIPIEIDERLIVEYYSK